jgi:hypothetical protein
MVAMIKLARNQQCAEADAASRQGRTKVGHMFTLRERTNGIFGTKDTAHLFDSFTAMMLCLSIMLAFGLGYSVGKMPLNKSQPVTASAAHQQTFGRLGRVQLP